MDSRITTRRGLWLLTGCLLAAPASAFDFGNMMNPNEWFNGDRDDYYGDYYGPPRGGYGYPGPYEPVPGYGAPGYGVPGYADPAYAPQGYGAPGYAAPGYALPAAPATTTPPAADSGSRDADAAEIARLKQRIRELEAERAGQTTHWQATQPPPDTGFEPRRGSSSWSVQTPTSPPSATSDTPQVYEPATNVPQPAGVWHPSPAAAPSAENSAMPPATGWSAAPPVQDSGAWQGAPGTAEGNASRYTPPSQYPGQPVYDLGR